MASKVKTTGNGPWTVDLSAWTTMRDVVRWRNAAGNMDIDSMNAIMAQVITTWPFDAPPDNPDSYLDLAPEQWGQAVKEVGNATGQFFRAS